MSVVEVCWRPLVPWYRNDFRNILEHLRVSNPHATGSEIQEAKRTNPPSLDHASPQWDLGYVNWICMKFVSKYTKQKHCSPVNFYTTSCVCKYGHSRWEWPYLFLMYIGCLPVEWYLLDWQDLSAAVSKLIALCLQVWECTKQAGLTKLPKNQTVIRIQPVSEPWTRMCLNLQQR